MRKCSFLNQLSVVLVLLLGLSRHRVEGKDIQVESKYLNQNVKCNGPVALRSKRGDFCAVQECAVCSIALTARRVCCLQTTEAANVH